MAEVETHKSSGEEIIGSIPNHWVVKPLRYVATMSDKKNYDGVSRRMLSVSQYHGIIEKGYESDDQRRSDEESATYWVVENHNLVANTMWLNFRGIGVSKGVSGYVSPAYRVYQLDQSLVAPDFVHHLMRSDLYVGIYTKNLKGIRPNSLQVSTYDFQHIPILLPPLDEQRLISRYLDKKTQQIDTLIEKIERKIELLKEQRASLINHYVTKGLDPNVEMKDSGVEWIGEIPKHWVISRIKFYLNGVVDTEHKTVHFEDDGEYHVIRTTDIKNGKIKLAKTKMTDALGYKNWTKRGIPESGDVLLTREAPAGECGVVEDYFEKFCMGQRIVWLKVRRDILHPRFLVFSIYSEISKAFIREQSFGSTVSHLNMSEIGNIPILYCPYNEQVNIVGRLNELDSNYTKFIEALERKISLLYEYRQSLISFVVTGKVRVTEDMV